MVFAFDLSDTALTPYLDEMNSKKFMPVINGHPDKQVRSMKLVTDDNEQHPDIIGIVNFALSSLLKSSGNKS